LEEGLITRIGSHKTVPVDVRVICATNKDLQQEMELGRFRRDLYYRINSIEIFLPPLRDRREDIPLLAKHFLQCFNNNCRLSPDAVEKLSEYSWPGNVRELKNIIERAAFLCDGAIITANDLCLPEKKQVIRSYSAKPVSATPVQELCPEIISQVLRECLAARRLQISRMTLYRKIKKYGLNLS
jgi:DNA-binding NtrC family response regulator